MKLILMTALALSFLSGCTKKNSDGFDAEMKKAMNEACRFGSLRTQKHYVDMGLASAGSEFDDEICTKEMWDIIDGGK